MATDQFFRFSSIINSLTPSHQALLLYLCVYVWTQKVWNQQQTPSSVLWNVTAAAAPSQKLYTRESTGNQPLTRRRASLGTPSPVSLSRRLLHPQPAPSLPPRQDTAAGVNDTLHRCMEMLISVSRSKCVKFNFCVELCVYVYSLCVCAVLVFPTPFPHVLDFCQNFTYVFMDVNF